MPHINPNQESLYKERIPQNMSINKDLPHKETPQASPQANENAWTEQMTDGCGEANGVKEVDGSSMA